MNRIKFVVFVYLLGVCGTGHAQDHPLENEKVDSHSRSMNEGQAIRIVALIDSVMNISDKSVDTGIVEELELLQSQAWELALSLWKSTSDDDVKKVIMKKWNEMLKKRPDKAFIQIYALATIWDESFLDDAFWSSVGESRDLKTIGAVKYLIYARGGQSDAANLRSACINANNTVQHELIKNLEDWLKYRETQSKGGTPPDSDSSYVLRILSVNRRKGPEKGVSPIK